MLRFAGHEKKTDYSVNPTEIVIFAHQNTSTMYAAGTIHNNGETVSYPAKERLFFDTFFQKTACRYLFSNHCGKISCIDISRFTFTGKERDEETGYGYFGARYMDHELMTMWLSVDPMADKYPNISPYAYCAWNPVKLVDPDGGEISPIYDKWGNLLGTDDQGLKGKAIVMDEGNFSQGMSHKDALRHNLGKNGFQDEIAYEKFSRHYAGLKDRPDYDGILSLPEANDWYRNGNGEPLYVDASKISLYPVTTSSFDKGEGCSITPNFLGEYMNYETGPVYGHIQLTLLNESTGEVRLGDSQGLLDNYGFEQQPKGGKWRNFATKIGKALAGNGRPYDIYTYKTGTVRRPYDIYDIIGTVKHKK